MFTTLFQDLQPLIFSFFPVSKLLAISVLISPLMTHFLHECSFFFFFKSTKISRVGLGPGAGWCLPVLSSGICVLKGLLRNPLFTLSFHIRNSPSPVIFFNVLFKIIFVKFSLKATISINPSNLYLFLSLNTLSSYQSMFCLYATSPIK